MLTCSGYWRQPEHPHRRPDPPRRARLHGRSPDLPGFSRQNIALRRALITNPNVLVEHVHRLLNLERGDGRTQVQRELYDRPGLTGDVLLELLGNDVSATLLADALAYFPDPDGTLAAHAAPGRWADSVMVRSQIVMSEHADRDLRERTALTLAPVEALNQKAAHAIAELAAERLAAATSAQEFATAWVDQVRAAAAGKTRTARLTKLPTQFLTPQYGASAWLQAAATTDNESIAWVATFTTDKAIREA